MTARAYIRSQLRDRMGVRHVPELTFAIDRSQKMTSRMEELLDRTRKRDRKRAVAESAPPVTTNS
jgi:ribosome-binding factor A